MSKGVRKLLLLAVVGVMALGIAPAALAAVGDMPYDMFGPALEQPGFEHGDATPAEPTTPVLDLPALNFVRDANGRICGDLPALKLCSSGRPAAPAPAPHQHAPKKLPKTGVNVGDILAVGMAAVAGGGVAARRLKLALVR